MVALKVVANVRLSGICVNDGPGASLNVERIAEKVLVISGMRLCFLVTVLDLLVIIVSMYWMAKVMKEVVESSPLW